MTLEVLICTNGVEGMNRVSQMNLPQVDGVKYLVSWQIELCNPIIPQELLRDDINVITLLGKGLSHNRNHSIKHATGDICLIADDDLSYESHQLQAVVDTFRNNPQVDIALFKHSGDDNKWYPDFEFDLISMPRGYYITSFEIAFRCESVAGKVLFDPRLGAGTNLPAGEESVFINDAIKAGLSCRFFPITIVHHNGLPTGARKWTTDVLKANGVYLFIVHKYSALLRIALIACRLSRQGKAKLIPAMFHMISGYIYGNQCFRNHL